MPILSSVMWNGVSTTGIYNGVQVWGGTPTVYNITLQTDGHGTISADSLSGYTDDVITLSQTANSEYTFSNYTITGATLTGSQFRIENSDVTAQANYTQNVYTLTLQTDGHGTIAATKTTGYKGDTVTLSNTYKTYYRFNNYTQTGGSLNGSTFTFGSENATAKANFKVNAFTASGGWEKGSNVTAYRTNANVGTKYATASYKTSNVPAAWYATSNRWKPNNASAYKITLHPIMKFSAGNGSTIADTAYATGVSLIGSTTTQSQTISLALAKAGNAGSTKTAAYNKTFTSTTQNVNYGISAKISYPAGNHYGTAMYVATGTTGTWTATGYIP